MTANPQNKNTKIGILYFELCSAHTVLPLILYPLITRNHYLSMLYEKSNLILYP